MIRAMIEVTKPKIGNRIYDGAVGSAGFLCEAYEYLTRDRSKLSTKDLEILQTRTFYGKEKKNLAYVIGVMNMILHGIEAPNILHTNTLSENIRDIREKARFDVILANPRSVARNDQRCSRISTSRRGRRRFCFCSISSKASKPVALPPSSSRTRF